MQSNRRGLAPVFITVPRAAELDRLRVDINLDQDWVRVLRILLEASERGGGRPPLPVLAMNIATMKIGNLPPKAEHILTGAAESEDPLPASCFVAQITANVLGGFDAVHLDEQARSDRLELARFFVSLPYYAQSYAYSAYVPAWWPAAHPEASLSTIEHERRTAVHRRIVDILGQGTAAQ
jgi:hypothetical protein